MEKKLLVSDYDDTFKTTPVPFEKNIKSVKNFRSKGNIFMIATARTYESIKEEVDKYKIEYDYLSCLDGAQLYDKDGKLLDATFIDEINKLNVKELKERFKYIESITPHTYEDKILYYTILTRIFVRTNELKDTIASNKGLRIRSIPGLIQVQPNFTVKSNSIEYLKKHLGIRDLNIYTIGDSENDIDIVRDYNGFNVLFATPGLYRVSQRPYVTVSGLINDIEKGKAKTRTKSY